MAKKYIVTIMDRHYLGDGNYLFSTNHAAIGEIDEKTGIFTDRYGNEYAPMANKELLFSEVPYAYSNTHELARIKESLGKDVSLTQAIAEYEFICKKMVYFIGLSEDNEVYCMKLNLDKVKNDIADLKRNANPDNQTEPKSEEQIEKEEEKEEDEPDSHINQLIADVVNGKYSIKELYIIKERLMENKEVLDQVIDTVDLQIEATENHESFSTVAANRKKEREEEEETPSVAVKPAISSKKVDINDLFNKVTKTLIAQDEPARRVIAEIARKEMDERKKREGILLTGPTGVGKTELMRLIAKYLNRPFHKIDSTQITVPGYTGKDIEEELWDLILECGGDVKRAEQAIIFFDEIDKKGSSRKSDVSGQGVINLLLQFIEGATYSACENMSKPLNKVNISTENMTIILGGAYTDVYKNLLEKNGVGFGSNVSSKPVYRKATTQDFIQYGMMTDEFMGRVTVIKLNDLDVDAIKRVMLESDQSAIKIQQDIFEKLGVKLTFTDGYTTTVAEGANKKKAGARGLNGIIDETTWKAFDEVYCHPDVYEEVILDEETVENPDHFQLIKRRESN